MAESPPLQRCCKFWCSPTGLYDWPPRVLKWLYHSFWKGFIAAFSGRDRVECVCSNLPENKSSLSKYYKKSSQTETIQYQTPNPLNYLSQFGKEQLHTSTYSTTKTLGIFLYFFSSHNPHLVHQQIFLSFHLQNIFINWPFVTNFTDTIIIIFYFEKPILIFKISLLLNEKIFEGP